MKKIAALAIALMGLMIFLPLVDARVDAKFVIKDLENSGKALAKKENTQI